MAAQAINLSSIWKEKIPKHEIPQDNTCALNCGHTFQMLDLPEVEGDDCPSCDAKINTLFFYKTFHGDGRSFSTDVTAPIIRLPIHLGVSKRGQVTVHVQIRLTKIDLHSPQDPDETATAWKVDQIWKTAEGKTFEIGESHRALARRGHFIRLTPVFERNNTFEENDTGKHWTTENISSEAPMDH